MWINSIELKNIKSYKHAIIPFERGINGISGENGAGKTTILESVGFALFNYSPVKQNVKKHFLRKGAKSGEVRVNVIASDGLEYVIVKPISGEYRVLSQIGQLAVGTSDVLDWIAENLFDDKIRPQELAPIFQNTVGVPQGTFTSAFRLTAAPRKKEFDRILKVDEYRTAFDNLSDVAKIVKNEIDDLDKRHHELKGSTANYGELKARFGHEMGRVSKIQGEIDELTKHLAQLGIKKDDLGKNKESIDSIRIEIEKLERDVKDLEKHLVTAKKQLEEAIAAEKVLEETKELKEEYLKSQNKLEGLEGEKKKRDHLNEQRLKQEGKIKQMELELEKKKTLSEELENHRKNLCEIEPLVKEQKEIEREIKSVEEQMRKIDSLQSDISDLKKKTVLFETLSNDLRRLEEERKEIEPLVKEQKEIEREIKSVEEQMREIDSLQSDISDLKKKTVLFETLSNDLRRLEEERKEIEPLVKGAEELGRQKQMIAVKKSGTQERIKSIGKNKKETGDTNQCPILEGVKCAAVTSFSNYFEEKLNVSQEELNRLKNELAGIENELKGLNDPEKRLNKNSSEISRITGQLSLLSDVKAGLQERDAKMKEHDSIFSQKYSSYLTDVPEDAPLPVKIGKTMAIMEERVHGLNDPDRQASKIDALMGAAKQELSRIKIEEGDLERENSALFDLKLGLSEFSDLDLRETDIRQMMSDCEPHYLKYLRNEKNAGKVALHRGRYDGVNREISEKLKENDRLHKALTEQMSTFDDGVYELVKTKHEAGKIELGSKKAKHGEISGNLEGLTKDLEIVKSLIMEKDKLLRECESKNEFLSYIEFIRSTLKDSAQLIAGKLIKNIGEEANRTYCEIINDYTQELRWTHDYAIIVTEHGEEKEFNQLSGGEQMGASLAVRFALLKILSGCDAVFLDEPTQNMDETRRERLSEQILNISGFKQVFVISHDDTFNEKYENVIRVEKIDGESRVVGGGVVS
ncbi:MAG: DNA double-strand break repair Rad50 ATPase [Candidatus Methanogaster sp.]|nr:MAG: DNA double-strand break repair Rad50 ATPase [ANME-2 cluster archaeon]